MTSPSHDDPTLAKRSMRRWRRVIVAVALAAIVTQGGCWGAYQCAAKPQDTRGSRGPRLFRRGNTQRLQGMAIFYLEWLGVASVVMGAIDYTDAAPHDDTDRWRAAGQIAGGVLLIWLGDEWDRRALRTSSWQGVVTPNAIAARYRF